MKKTIIIEINEEDEYRYRDYGYNADRYRESYRTQESSRRNPPREPKRVQHQWDAYRDDPMKDR